jgi:peptide/nickel transport system substrate-binding protein
MKKFLLTMLVGLLALPLAPASADAQGKENRLIYAYSQEWDNLDPHLIHDIAKIGVKVNMYDNLLRWENNPPELTPWLAEGYKVSGEGLKVTFKLRTGVKFHDGTELTAEAVQYSMDRLLALGQGPAPLFLSVVKKGSTRVIDKYTVEFNLGKPYSPFLSIIPDLYIVNPKICQAHQEGNDWGSKWLASHEAGSGSYQLASYNPASGFTISRFKDHFMGWKGKHVDVVEFRIIRELSSRMLALQKGEIHAELSFNSPAAQLEKLSKDPNLQVIKEMSMKTFVVKMNCQRPPFNDVHVRRAFSYAFDYEGYIKEVMGNLVTRNPGPIPNNLWGAPKDLKGYEFNLEKARKELSLAKEKVTRPLLIHCMVGNAEAKATALILQNSLSQLGIRLNIVEETWPVLIGKCRQAETTPDFFPHYVSMYYADPHNWIGDMYHSANHGSWKAGSWYKNPTADALLAKALTVFDKEERRKLYEEASRVVVDDAVSIWVYNKDFYGPVRKNVRGIRFCPIYEIQDCRWIYLED